MANMFSGIVSSTGVQLEKTAKAQFGAAVDQGVGQVLGGMFGGKFSSDSRPQDAATAAALITGNRVFDTTPYAAALAGGKGNYDPRIKFLFRIRLKFNPEVAANAASLMSILSLNKGGQKQFEQDLSYVVKQIDLPKVNYEYEDVNMYNFRTKVLRKIENQQLSMTFYDDVGNHALNFINLYRVLLQPIGRTRKMNGMQLEDHGLAFSSILDQGLESGNRAILAANNKTILSSLVIEQFYMDRTAPLSAASRFNTFEFANPRLVEFDIADQDHEDGSGVGNITLAFNYDALYIFTNNDARKPVGPGLQTPDMALADINAGASAQGGGATGNIFSNIILGAAGKIVTTAATSAINKALSSVSPGLARALSGATGQIGTAIGGSVTGVFKPNQTPPLSNYQMAMGGGVSPVSDNSAPITPPAGIQIPSLQNQFNNMFKPATRTPAEQAVVIPAQPSNYP